MAKDAIHEPVKNALIKDGWTITADPYTLKIVRRYEIAIVVVRIETEEVVQWID